MESPLLPSKKKVFVAPKSLKSIQNSTSMAYLYIQTRYPLTKHEEKSPKKHGLTKIFLLAVFCTLKPGLWIPQLCEFKVHDTTVKSAITHTQQTADSQFKPYALPRSLPAPTWKKHTGWSLPALSHILCHLRYLKEVMDHKDHNLLSKQSFNNIRYLDYDVQHISKA